MRISLLNYTSAACPQKNEVPFFGEQIIIQDLLHILNIRWSCDISKMSFCVVFLNMQYY